MIAPQRVAYYDTDTILDNYSGYEGAWGVYPLLPSHHILGSDQTNGLFILEFGELDPIPLPPSQSSGNLLDEKYAATDQELSPKKPKHIDPVINDPNKIFLYPNPAPNHEQVNLSFKTPSKEKVEVVIHDISGRLIWQKKIHYSTKDKITLPKLDSGIYQVIVKDAHTYQHKRLLVKD